MAPPSSPAPPRSGSDAPPGTPAPLAAPASSRRSTSHVPVRAISPTGNCRKKTARQPSADTSTPPIDGPAAIAADWVAVQSPTAVPRRSAAKYGKMRVSASGVIVPPPAPCTSLAATSTDADGASPQASELAVNTARPIRNTRLRPNLSARPAAGSSAAV